MNPNTDRIRALNDALRQHLTGGTAVMTAGIAALGPEAVDRIVKTIALFDDFCHANDPYGEHDFGCFEADGHSIFFKIDLYEPQLVNHSSIGEPLFVSPHNARRRSRVIRSWPCAPAHRLVSGESASTLFPQSVFTCAEGPKAQVANQTTSRLRNSHRSSRSPTASPLVRQAR